MIAVTPSPPYYTIIFTSIHTDVVDGYSNTDARMVELAHEQPFFLGVESARNEVGIWDLDAIRSWKQQAEHRIAQRTGHERWYENHKTRTCRVERDYELNLPNCT